MRSYYIQEDEKKSQFEKGSFLQYGKAQGLKKVVQVIFLIPIYKGATNFV